MDEQKAKDLMLLRKLLVRTQLQGMTPAPEAGEEKQPAGKKKRNKRIRIRTARGGSAGMVDRGKRRRRRKMAKESRRRNRSRK